MLTYGPVTLVVPEGALSAPVTITLSEIPDAPRGAVGPAYSFGPDGLEFARPATLEVLYDGLALPVGTEPPSLRLAVLDRERWTPLEGHVNSRADRRVSGSLRHFSTYGVIPDPREVSGRGTRWEANGIAVDASEEMFGRLFVSPTAVSLFLGGEATGSVAITFSGLPTDDDNHLYVDGYDGGVVVAPADGGVVTLTVDGRSPHYLWLQPRPGTTIIGGPADQCPSVGVRSGTTCTLTRDIVAGVSIEAGGETLDCAGYGIYQPFADRGTGIGVLVGGFGAAGPRDDVTIRNCVVGGPDAGFFEGLAATGTSATRVLDSTFSDNIVAAYFGAATNARVAGNRLDGAGNFGIQMYEGSSDGEIAGNTIALVPGIEPIGMMFKGMEGKLGPVPTTRITAVENSIAGGSVGVGFVFAEGNHVSENDIDGPDRGVWIGTGGSPNRFWWNNVTATTWGVYAEIGPVEVSDGASWGNWWGHSCPGPLFTPGVESNRPEVVDSFAYGARDAWLAGGVPGCPGDADGDTVPDGLDNCPGAPNPGQENEDGVGEGDACDVTAPPAPVITAPPPRAVLTTPSPTIGGSAERRSVVTIFEATETLVPVGTLRAGDDGSFAFGPGVLVDGHHIVVAMATDAVGNRSVYSEAVLFRIDTVPPPAPVITSPVSGEIVPAGLRAIGGEAEPHAAVRLFDGGASLGEAPADADGLFVFAPAAPLAPGAHTLTAVARDEAGHESTPSAAVAFTVSGVSGTSPLYGTAGKLALVGVSDSPDPMDPLNETSKLDVSFLARPVAGLGGASENHEFSIALSWKVLSPDGAAVVKTVSGATVIATVPGGGGADVSAAMDLSWNGQDEAGNTVALGALHPYEVKADFIRAYVGPGVGPPCSRDETPIVTGPGSAACLVDTLSLARAGTVYVQHVPFDSDSKQVWQTVRRIGAEHRRIVSVALAGLSAAEQEARLAYARTIGEQATELRFRYSRDGVVRSVAGHEVAIPVQAAGSDARTVALAAVTIYRWLFGLHAPAQDLAFLEARQDSGGGWHLHFSQHIGALPVFRGGLVVHLTPDLKLSGFSAFTVPRDRVDTVVPAVSAATAEAVARGAAPPGVTLVGSEAVLGVFAPEPAGLRGGGGALAWRVHLSAADSGDDLLVYVAATDARVLHVARVALGATPDYLIEYDTGDGTFRPVFETFPAFSYPGPWPGTSVAVYDGTAAAFQYLDARLGRDSWSGCAGAPAEMWARADVTTFTGLGRWIPVTTQSCWPPFAPSRGVAEMTPFGACTELVRHEFDHGRQQQAGWLSADLPTAEVAEGVADVMSQLAEAWDDNRSDGVSDWVVRYAPDWMSCTAPVRDIGTADRAARCAWPVPGGTSLGPHPADMADYYYTAPAEQPHYNSTIAGRIGYLMGRSPGQGPEMAWRFPISGIGEPRTSRLWNDATVTYLGAAPVDIRELAEALVDLAQRLFTPIPEEVNFAILPVLDVVGWWGDWSGEFWMCDAPAGSAVVPVEIGGEWRLYFVYTELGLAGGLRSRYVAWDGMSGAWVCAEPIDLGPTRPLVAPVVLTGDGAPRVYYVDPAGRIRDRVLSLSTGRWSATPGTITDRDEYVYAEPAVARAQSGDVLLAYLVGAPGGEGEVRMRGASDPTSGWSPPLAIGRSVSGPALAATTWPRGPVAVFYAPTHRDASCAPFFANGRIKMRVYLPRLGVPDPAGGSWGAERDVLGAASDLPPGGSCERKHSIFGQEVQGPLSAVFWRNRVHLLAVAGDLCGGTGIAPGNTPLSAVCAESATLCEEQADWSRLVPIEPAVDGMDPTRLFAPAGDPGALFMSFRPLASPSAHWRARMVR